MFDQFIASVRSFASFSDEEIETLLAKVQTRTLAKGEKVLLSEAICSEVSFIQEGCCYQYYMDDGLNKVIVNLFPQFEWVLDATSFTSRKPSITTIEAFEESTIHQLSIHDLHELISRHPAFFALGKVLEPAESFADQRTSPDEKYELLLETKPAIVHTFPLKFIASYLGITPETLSRVRSRLT